MTLLPNGRSERAALDDELTAAREFQRLTELYLARGPLTVQRATPLLGAAFRLTR